MRSRALSLSLIAAVAVVPLAASCSSPADGGGDDVGIGGTGNTGAGGTAMTGGVPAGGAAGASVTGGAAGASVTGGAAGASVTGGAAGVSMTGGAAGAGLVGGSGGNATSGAAGIGMGGSTSGTGGSAAGVGGTPGGMGGRGGTGVGGSFAGAAGTPMVPALDCGPKGQVIENAGPPSNRVNYVIVGDGYRAGTEIDTTYINHINVYMTKRFSTPIGQVYGRYRKFINICALKIPSTAGISTEQSAFRCGEYQPGNNTRLAECDSGLINQAISQNLPTTFEKDWNACVLNGSSWWNSGGALMLWSGGNQDAAGAALHEGGHGFHALADEYTGTSSDCGEKGEVNSTAANNGASNPKWGIWVGYNATDATGMQGFFQGSRYCSTSSGQYRPTSNSMMNSLFGNNQNTSFNAVSREKMVLDIWRIVQQPWDSVVPPAGAVTNPTMLTVNVIDPTVIKVDWSVDGTMVATAGPPTYNIGAANLAPGTHMVTARAFDDANMDLVRYRTGTTFNRQYWAKSSQTVTWTVTIQ